MVMCLLCRIDSNALSHGAEIMAIIAAPQLSAFYASN